MRDTENLLPGTRRTIVSGTVRVIATIPTGMTCVCESDIGGNLVFRNNPSFGAIGDPGYCLAGNRIRGHATEVYAAGSAAR